MTPLFQIVSDLCKFPVGFPPECPNATGNVISLELYDAQCHKFANLAKHTGIKSEIFQAFREIGNGIMVSKLLEKSLVFRIN